MTKFGDRPLRCGVTLAAVAAEQSAVSVLGLMARRAIEQRLFWLELRRMQCLVPSVHPADERVTFWIVRCGSVLDLTQADARERDVIHLRRAGHTPLVFEMAGHARGDFAVKGGRLALEDGLVVGVTHNAFARNHALDRRVAGRAIILERGVSLRQLSGTDHVLPKGERKDLTRRLVTVMRSVSGKLQEREYEQCATDCHEQKHLERGHEYHLSPRLMPAQTWSPSNT